MNLIVISQERHVLDVKTALRIITIQKKLPFLFFCNVIVSDSFKYEDWFCGWL